MPIDLTETNSIPNGQHLGTIIEFKNITSKGGKDGVQVKFQLTAGEWEGKNHVAFLYQGGTILQLATAAGLEDKLKTPAGKWERNYVPDPNDYLNEEVGFFTQTAVPSATDPKPFTNYTFFAPSEYVDEENEIASTVVSSTAGVAGRRPANARR